MTRFLVRPLAEHLAGRESARYRVDRPSSYLRTAPESPAHSRLVRVEREQYSTNHRSFRQMERRTRRLVCDRLSPSLASTASSLSASITQLRDVVESDRTVLENVRQLGGIERVGTAFARWVEGGCVGVAAEEVDLCHGSGGFRSRFTEGVVEYRSPSPAPLLRQGASSLSCRQRCTLIQVCR